MAAGRASRMAESMAAVKALMKVVNSADSLASSTAALTAALKVSRMDKLTVSLKAPSMVERKVSCSAVVTVVH